MMMKRLTTIATVSAFVSAIGTPAIAQHAARPAHTGRAPHGAPASSPPPAATSAAPAPVSEDPLVAEARREYAAGQSALAAHTWDEAVQHFQRAYEIRPNPVVLLPIAAAQEGLGHTVDAIATLERYLHDRPDAPDRATVEHQLEGLRATPSVMHVDSTPPGARIVVDETDSGQVTPADVSMPPGHHTLRVTGDSGHSPYEQAVDVTPGARNELMVSLTLVVQAAPAAPPAPRGVSPVVWIAAAVTAGGLVAGSVFGFMALDDHANYVAMPTAATRDSGETHAVLSDVFFGAAVLAAAVGIVVWIAGDGERATAPSALNTPRHRAPQLHVSPFGMIVNF